MLDEDTAAGFFLANATVTDAAIRQVLLGRALSAESIIPKYGEASMKDVHALMTQMTLHSGFLLNSSLTAAVQRVQQDSTLVTQLLASHPWADKPADHKISFPEFEQWFNSKEAWLMKSKNRALGDRLVQDFRRSDANQDAKLQPGEKTAYLSRAYYLVPALRDALGQQEEEKQSPSEAKQTPAAAAGQAVRRLVESAASKNLLPELTFRDRWHER
jgi:hypothetical protein